MRILLWTSVFGWLNSARAEPPTQTGVAAAARPSQIWPTWEAGGQLSLNATSSDAAIRTQGHVGRFFGPHEIEYRLRASRVLSATLVDSDVGYALHIPLGEVLGFVRGGLGLRWEHLGGGALRTRSKADVGTGIKWRVSPAVALRMDLNYNFLFGAPLVANELDLLLGLSVLW